jgi:hypothetical protein
MRQDVRKLEMQLSRATISARTQGALEKEFLYIIGAPRSGTTWLQLMLAAHPAVCASAELRLYSKYIAPWLQSWNEEARLTEGGRPYIGLPVLWKADELHNFLEQFLDQVYSKVLATKPEATHILDKHPGYALCVENIHCFVPRARFIHLVRDGRDVAVSLFAASRELGWFARKPLHDYAELWQQRVLAARKAKSLPGCRYFELRYEDLSASPAEVLKGVFDFCALDASDALIADIVEKHTIENLKLSRPTPVNGVKLPEGHFREGKVGNWSRHFKAGQRYLFDKVAGGLLRELGYARAGWWAERPHLKLWAPLAALGLRLYRFLRRFEHAAAVLLGRRIAVRPPDEAAAVKKQEEPDSSLTATQNLFATR